MTITLPCFSRSTVRTHGPEWKMDLLGPDEELERTTALHLRETEVGASARPHSAVQSDSPRLNRQLTHGTPLSVTPSEHRPIRVCYMIDRLSPAGTESQLVALIRNLDRSQVVPYLCLLDGSDEPSRALEPACCPVLRLGIRSFRNPLKLGQALRFARFLSHNEIDVLQVYFPRSTYVGVLVGRLAGVPYIVRTRNNLGYWMTPCHQWMGRLYNRLVDSTVANCEPCRQAVIRDEDTNPESVVVLENGVDVTRFLDIPSLGSKQELQTIGIVANLRPVKDLDSFVRCAAVIRGSHPRVRFVIAGEGELRPRLERQIDDLGLSCCFRLPGSVTDIPRFLAQIDIAVLCSQSEGMSNAILEYMASGRAIIATAVGANAQLLEDGVHGLLIPPNDRSRLADAMDRLLRNPGLAAQLGAAARQRACECYSREAMVRRFEAFYQALVRRRGYAHGTSW